MQRVRDLLRNWQTDRNTDVYVAEAGPAGLTKNGRMPSQDAQPVLARLARIDPLHTTPLDALRVLAELKKLAEGEI